MGRDEFQKRHNNENTISNYKKSFKKLDEFLQQENITEQIFLDALNNLPLHQKYNKLQKLIDFIKVNVSAGTTKQYFDNLFIYFLLEGAPLDYTQKKIRLSFPRKATVQFEGLDENSVKLLCSCGSVNFQTYLSTLGGAGLRESECLLLEPQMILFSEYPTRIKLPKEITKFNIKRDTFLPPKNSQKIQQLIEFKKTSYNQTIFTTHYSRNTLKDFEQQFAQIRKKCNLETPNRIKHQQNDITLHSLRSYFITIITDQLNEATAHALAGHSRYMKTYYRKPLSKRQTEFASIMRYLEF